MPTPAANRPTRVRLTVDGPIAIIALADPERRNALALEMTRDLASTVASAASRSDISAIVVMADPPVFSSGGSLDDLLEPRAPLEELYAGFEAIAAAPIPTIAAVGGAAIGAGVNVALACDVIVCSSSARFDPRFLDVGIQPGGGLLWRLRERVGRQAAAALVLCGESLDGDRAAELGLAWCCVPDDELLDAALALARRAAERPRPLLERAKRTLDESAAVTDGAGAVALELEPQRDSMADPMFVERLERIRARVRGES